MSDEIDGWPELRARERALEVKEFEVSLALENLRGKFDLLANSLWLIANLDPMNQNVGFSAIQIAKDALKSQMAE